METESVLSDGEAVKDLRRLHVESLGFSYERERFGKRPRKQDNKYVFRTYRLALSEFLLSTVEIKVHVQAFHELGDGVLVGIRLLKKTKETWMMVTFLIQHHTFILN